VPLPVVPSSSLTRAVPVYDPSSAYWLLSAKLFSGLRVSCAGPTPACSRSARTKRKVVAHRVTLLKNSPDFERRTYEEASFVAADLQ
jgi:hypothetical protein